ncbi:MAG: zinc ribbon domain-containing protein [Candidatus Thorarchaeota archaeon]
MYQSKQCPKCGGGDIAGPHNVHGGDRHIKIDLPGISTATLLAVTCVRCGYTELYSDGGGLKNIRSSGRFLSRERHHQPAQVRGPRKCPVCGTKIKQETQYCSECGSMVA